MGREIDAGLLRLGVKSMAIYIKHSSRYHLSIYFVTIVRKKVVVSSPSSYVRCDFFLVKRCANSKVIATIAKNLLRSLFVDFLGVVPTGFSFVFSSISIQAMKIFHKGSV